MNWLTRMPIRSSLPILLGLFAILVSILSYLGARPAIYEMVEQQASDRMLAKLTETQGAVEFLWSSGDLDAIQRFIATYGAEHGETATMLVGPDGNVIASTSLSSAGRKAESVYPTLDPDIVSKIAQTGASSVELISDRKNVEGYVSVCRNDNTSLRAQDCGYFFHAKDLRYAYGTAVNVIRSQMRIAVASIAAGTLLLLVLTHFMLTRRAQHLVQSTRQYSLGETHLRTRLAGQDEFAEIGHAIDDMLDRIETDQAALHLRGDAIAASKNGIVITDAKQADHPIIYCNPAFKDMSGYEADEVIGRNCRFLQGEDRGQPGVKRLREAIETGDSCKVTLRNYHKDGTAFWNELSISPVRGDDGEITNFIGIQSDISSRINAEEQLRESHKNLETRVKERTQELAIARDTVVEASAAKSRFLAAASHDLRQPLQAISMYLSALDTQLDKSKQKMISEKMHHSMQTMRELLNTLLDVSKLDSGSITPEEKSFPVQTLFDAISADYGPSAKAKGLKLEVAPCKLPIYSDPVLLLRIVENFVGNAIRYTNEGGISVFCEDMGKDVKISVSDTGIGMPKMALKRVFEEYYQLDNAHRNQEKGLGLGLSIVKHIARILSVQLTVESTEGSGSTFSVSIPKD